MLVPPQSRKTACMHIMYSNMDTDNIGDQDLLVKNCSVTESHLMSAAAR